MNQIEMEIAYVVKNIPFEQIRQQESSPSCDFLAIPPQWEIMRQAYRTAEYLYYVKGYSFEEISHAVPIPLEQLYAHEEHFLALAEAYQAAITSPYLAARQLLMERITERLAGAARDDLSIAELQQIVTSLQHDAKILDIFEIIINMVITEYFPKHGIIEADKERYVNFLYNLRGFLKLALLSV